MKPLFIAHKGSAIHVDENGSVTLYTEKVLVKSGSREQPAPLHQSPRAGSGK